MKQIFIDKFIIPAIAEKEFTEQMNYNRNFIKKLDGFIKDTVYKRTGDAGNLVVITIAIWDGTEVLEKAKQAVQAEYQRIGFNPSEFMAKLNITMERDIYNESAD